MRTLTQAVLAGILSISLCPAAAQKPACPAEITSGEWQAAFDVQGNAAGITLKFKLEGDKLTGTSDSAHMGPGTISNGSCSANKIAFTLQSGHGALEVNGTLQNGKLAGSFNGGNGMEGKWEASKAH